VSAVWSDALPGLSHDPSDDLTGKANGYERVRGVQQRYGQTLMRLPGVHGHGLSRTAVLRGGAGPPPADARDWCISVWVLPNASAPEPPVFLDGVPLIVQRCEMPRALPVLSAKARVYQPQPALLWAAREGVARISLHIRPQYVPPPFARAPE
jgi:hypothetical protein